MGDPMDSQHTLFIVGAGASVDFGLPVGDALANTIRRRAETILLGEPHDSGTTRDWLFQHHAALELRSCQAALKKIAERLYPAASIDRFIDQNSHDPFVKEVGKALIAACISEAEERCTLSLKHGSRVDLQQEKISASWCDVFLKLLVKGTKWATVDEQLGQNFSVITFNYDRCIERYLISGLQQAFGLSYRGAWEAVYNRLNIIHAYGDLGRLPDVSEESGEGVPFGPAKLDPWELSKAIRTFTEQDIDPKVQSKISDTILKAHRIVFLGFSFEQLNMELLAVPEAQRRKVLASAYGIQSTEREELTLRIRHMLGVQSDQEHTSVQLAFGRDCKQTLSDFYYQLTSYLA